jgi:hypothetical protein
MVEIKRPLETRLDLEDRCVVEMVRLEAFSAVRGTK